MTKFYPQFDPGLLIPLHVAFDQMANDPLWLDRADCHYDEDTKNRLRDIWTLFRVTPKFDTVEALPIDDENKWDNLGETMHKLFKELSEYSSNILIDDVKERMAYYRTATALLEKITGLAERIANVKAVHEFTSRVLATFDEVLTPEQRTSAIIKLKA